MMSSWNRFQSLIEEIWHKNRFYAQKYANLNLQPTDFRSLKDLQRLPFTTKADLLIDQQEHPPFGHILTYPLEAYCRLHQTSGTTTGKPLRWLDTRPSWDWLLHCWQISFPFMGLSARDVFFFPFSFGPFLGFWSAFEAASRAGFLCIPGGGMTSTARLRFLTEIQATVVCCTPTYALHLAELAAKEKIDLASSAVRAVIVAGEPGGSIPSTRERIEQVWGARVFDHYGMTEVGPVAVECEEVPGEMAILESEYLIEIIEPNTTRSVNPGEVGELVVTNLGRIGCPLIRYRTGDLVRAKPRSQSFDPKDPTHFLRLEGGILGRTDDMIYLRGNNVYPATVEAVIRRFPEVVEFRLVVDQTGPLTDLRIEIEPETSIHASHLAEAVARAIRDELLFRVEVDAVPPGTLPRFEMKAKRVFKKV
jgi:phenylacetate-CoA ligase